MYLGQDIAVNREEECRQILVGNSRQDFSLLRIHTKTSTSVNSRQNVQTALEIFSRVSRNGSVVSILRGS